MVMAPSVIGVQLAGRAAPAACAAGGGAGDGDVGDVGGCDGAGPVGHGAGLPGGVGRHRGVVAATGGQGGGEGEAAVGGHAEVVAPVVLEDHGSGQAGDGAADGVGAGGVAAGPALSGGAAVGHDAGAAAGHGGVGGGDLSDPVLGEDQARSDGGELQLGAGGQGPGGVAAQRSEVAVDALEQHEDGGAVLPPVEAQVEVLAAGLGSDGHADPLTAAQLGGGGLNLGILVAGEGLAGVDLTGVGAGVAPRHLPGGRDGHGPVGHGRPIGAQFPGRRREVVARGARSCKGPAPYREQRDKQEGSDEYAHPRRPGGPESASSA